MRIRFAAASKAVAIEEIKCGAPVGSHINTAAPAANTTAKPPHRQVGVLLALGVLFAPYIFSWLLLRPGYSREARLLGFGWPILLLIGVGLSGLSNGKSANTSSISSIDVDPYRWDKEKVVFTAKRVVRSALKDPSSAEFGTVIGLSATVACGSVNSKNSFGAMTGATMFIFDAGSVTFESEAPEFGLRWNSTCIDKPSAPPPIGAGDLRWGIRPPSNLKLETGLSNKKQAVYVSIAPPTPLEGVKVADAKYIFNLNRLTSAYFHISGERERDAILSAYVKRYGTPQEYDGEVGRYVWKWPHSSNSISLLYNADEQKTTVSITRM